MIPPSRPTTGHPCGRPSCTSGPGVSTAPTRPCTPTRSCGRASARERSGRSPCGHPRCGTRWPATVSSTTLVERPSGDARPIGSLLRDRRRGRGDRARAGPAHRPGGHGRHRHRDRARVLRGRPRRATGSGPARGAARSGAPARAVLAARAPARGPRPQARGGHRPVRGRVLRQPARQRPGHGAGRRRPGRVPRPAPGRVGAGQRRLPVVDGRPDGARDDRRRPGAAAGRRHRRRLARPGRTVVAMGRSRTCSRRAVPRGSGRASRWSPTSAGTSRPSCGS